MNLSDPEATQPRRARFDPIQIGIQAAILVAFLALVLLIALLSAGEKIRRPRRRRLMVSRGAALAEMLRQAPVGEVFRDVA
jgi:hypothetical protein